CEHKERYIPLINRLKDEGYASIISDNRGHGKSINDKYVLGNTGDPMDMVGDQYNITKYIKEIYPNKKIIIFGHSMGTLISRAYMMRYDDLVSGVILSGTVCPNSLSWLAVLISKLKCIGRGKNKSSSLLYAFSNGFSFKDDISWISTDDDELLKYKEDPLCGFRFKNNGYKTLFYLVDYLNKANLYQIKNKDLKIVSLSGSSDRTTGGTRGLNNTKKALNKAGYNNIIIKEYPNMKHEILNELNNDIVYDDIIKYIGDII
ncbi:MAG: alpha/beta fold hydrolase, partial [Acholeplasmatales bacterium]|nr:alpha/beta fold hydrolase [Acholeplasmatales bacterium]